MSPGEFLRLVWPSEGIYCLATPWTTPDQRRVYAQRTFESISDAVSFVLEKRGTNDLYFNVHTLKEHSVWNPAKTNAKTGEKGANEIRVQRNAKAAKCFFFDLDIGEDPDKYADQREAIDAVRKFCLATELPRPMLVNSGGGVHVYWLVSEALDSDEWRDHAVRLRQLAQHHGLRVDPTRTTDTASLLRIVGTSNWKKRQEPRPVELIIAAAEISGTGAFCKKVQDAVIRAGMEVKSAPRLSQAESLFGSNLDMPYDGPRPSAVALISACAQVRRLAELDGKFSEPEWYHTAIGLGRFTENPDRFIHKISAGHPEYSHDACEAKVKQSEERQSGPTSCATVAYHSRVKDTLCIGCPFQGKVFGPIQAALFKDEAPAPVHELVVEEGEEPITIDIPDAPRPFLRIKGGGVAIVAKNADGEEGHSMIYDYDLYPVRRLVNATMGIEQQIWHVELPRGEAKDFTLNADMLYDTRGFTVAISNQGIYPNKGHVSSLQEYMVAYISKLQQLVDADAQCNHLGWSDEYSRFIMPDKVICADGTSRIAQLSLGAQRASLHVHKKGTMAEQVRLLKFYEHPSYLPNQFFILAGLAAPIFYMTGHHGVIINASGDAGASKSTSLYTAASFWGQPELYPINGTNNGATVRGRNERVTVLANLPVCVDEITHMPVTDAQDLAMSITQPGHRIRLQSDGVERAAIDSYKATIMLATANSSLHSLLSNNNAAGTAGSMRVVEIMFKANDVHRKHEADDFLDALKENFGHVGEAFVKHVIANRVAVKQRVRQVMREIDIAARIDPSERFWSATIAAVLVAAEIARELGLLSYSVEALRKWVLEHQIPHMRGVVIEEYSDPLAILADYLEQINNNMIVVERSTLHGQINFHASRKPTGPLLAHYDTHQQLLHVLKKGFKDYCVRVGANSTRVLGELAQLRDGSPIVCQPHTRRVLGANTDYAKAQSWCFTVNMTHREVSGVIDLEVIKGGNEGGVGDKKPSLAVV